MKRQIEVESIGKKYKTYIKEDGLANTLKGIIKRKYSYVEAVKNVSFSVDQGEILGIIGLNGAGKTTIIKTVAGIVKSDSGNCSILGENPFKKSKSYRKNVALIMGQKGQLDRDLSILDSVKLFASFYDIDKGTAIERAHEMGKELLLNAVDLKKQVRSLSLGQRMKGELILSFIHRPKIVFLDEPTLGLDFLSQRAIRNYLKIYKREHKASIILTSHYITDIEDLCDNILVMNKGRSIYYGTIDELKNDMPNIKGVKFKCRDQELEALREKYNVSNDLEDKEMLYLKFNPEDTSEVIKELSSISGISDITFVDDTLDILIENLYREDSYEEVENI